MASNVVEYIPKKEMEDLTMIDVLKIAGTIQLVDQLDVFKEERKPSKSEIPDLQDFFRR